MIVVTADQAHSRARPDRVPELLRRLLADAAVPRYALPPERTAGDEIQAVLADPDGLAPTIEVLLRAGDWHVGIGIGAVDAPLPASARAGRGPAYLAARVAVEAAKRAPSSVAVRVPDDVEQPDARALESALWLWAGLLARRTEAGWEVVDGLRAGATHAALGATLGITQSAVSQRARAAGFLEGERGAALVTHLAGLVAGAREDPWR